MDVLNKIRYIADELEKMSKLEPIFLPISAEANRVKRLIEDKIARQVQDQYGRFNE